MATIFGPGEQIILLQTVWGDHPQHDKTTKLLLQRLISLFYKLALRYGACIQLFDFRLCRGLVLKDI